MRPIALLLLALVVLPACGSEDEAPTASEPEAAAAPGVHPVLEALAAAETARLNGVDNFSTVTTIDGPMASMFDRITAYYVRDSSGTFTTRTRLGGGLIEAMGNEGGDSTVDEAPGVINPISLGRRLADEFADRAEPTGTETVEGQTVEVFRIPRARALFEEAGGDFAPGGADAAAGPDSSVATVYVDPQANVVRRLVVADQQEVEGEMRTITVTVDMADYRALGTLQLPYRMTIRTANPLSESERAQLQRDLAQQRAQMAQVPEAMRPLIEGQINMAEAMASGEDLVMTMTVVESAVNEGPPAGLE